MSGNDPPAAAVGGHDTSRGVGMGDGAVVDRRVRRTRAALSGALVDLIIEKGYEAVTVAEIVERADVGRSTFYAHFRDKDELLLSGAEVLRSALVAGAGPEPFGFSLELFRHARSHRLLHRAIAGRRAGTLVYGWLGGLVAELVREDLHRYPLRPGAAVPLEPVVQAVAGGCLALLTSWLEEETPVRPEEMDRIFRTLARATAGVAVRFPDDSDDSDGHPDGQAGDRI